MRDAHQFLRLHQSWGAPKEVSAYNTLIFCPDDSNIRQFWLPRSFPWLKASPVFRQDWGYNFNTLKGHTDWVRSIAFSTDGQFIASGSDDSSVRIWDIEMGTTQHIFQAKGGWIYSVAFSSRGLVAAGSDDSSVIVWNTSTGQEHARLPDQDGTPCSLCFSPDGTKLAFATSTDTSLWEVRLWEVKQNKGEEWNQLATLGGFKSEIQRNMFCANGKFLAAGSSDGEMAIWNVETLQLEQTFFIRHEGRINGVIFSEDGNLIASGDDDGIAYIWNTNKADPISKDVSDTEGPDYDIKRRLHELTPNTGSIQSIAFSTDAQVLRLATATENAIHIWNAETGASLEVLFLSSNDVRSVIFAPQGSYLASGSSGGGVHLWYDSAKATARDPVYRVSWEDRIVEMAVHPEGKIIAAALDSGSVFLWDVEKKERLQRDMKFGHEETVLQLDFSPDGEYLLSGSMDNTARICHVMTGELKHVFRHHEDWVRGVAWSHNGKYIATASDDSTAHVWEIGGREWVVLTSGLKDSLVRCVAFSPGSHYIVIGGVEMNVVVWEWKAGEKNEKERVSLKGHNDTVMDVLVTNDSRHIVSSSYDGTVRVWDIKTKEQLQRIEVDWAILNIWSVPQSNDYIMSAHGALTLNPSATRIPPWSPWQLKYEKEGWLWIVHGDKKAIFIPSMFSPQTACVIGNKVIMGLSKYLHVYELSLDTFIATTEKLID